MSGMRSFGSTETSEHQFSRYTIVQDKLFDDAVAEWARANDEGGRVRPTNFGTKWAVAHEADFPDRTSGALLQRFLLLARKARPDLCRSYNRVNGDTAPSVPRHIPVAPPPPSSGTPAMTDYQKSLDETIKRSIASILKRPDANAVLHQLAAKAYELAGPPPPPEA